MATRTVSRTSRTGRTESDGVGPDGRNGQEAGPGPVRPAIWVQVVTAGGSSQPVGVPLDAPNWEEILDNVMMQVRVLALRETVAMLRRPG